VRTRIGDDDDVSDSASLSVSRRRPAPATDPVQQLRGPSPALWWLPALCAAGYAAAVILNFHAIITSVYVNSDAALAPVLGQAAAHLPAGTYISLGNHAWYEEWLFLLATRSLPSHRGLWELAPALWSLCGVLLLAWSARRAFDAWSASISAAALLCAGAFGRFCMLAVNWHSLALVHTILVAAALVWIAGRVERMSARAVAAAAVALGALSALPTASDTLFPFWALIPLGGASAVVAGRLTPRARGKLALFTLTVIAVAILGGVLLAAVMRAGGITARSLPVGLVASNMLTHNLALLARSDAFLGGGRLSALGPTLEGVLLFASAVMVLCALLLALEQARRLLMRRALRRGMSPAALAYLSFWSLSLLCTTLVFILSDAPKDALSGRYLLAGYAAAAALLPLAGAGVRSRRALTAGVCAFALIGTYQVLRAPFTVITSPEVAVRFPGPSAAAELKAFAASEHVSVGYGGYWDAEELTWATDFAVPVRPVRTCDPLSHTLCYPQLGMISSWYEPRSGIRSLLIVDSLDTSFNAVLHPDPELGAPVAERNLGYIRALVYPYDIASRIHTPHCHFTWPHPC